MPQNRKDGRRTIHEEGAEEGGVCQNVVADVVEAGVDVEEGEGSELSPHILGLGVLGVGIDGARWCRFQRG
jgi:hypothetical protein